MTALSFDVFARDHASATFDKLGNSVDRSTSKLERMQRISGVAGKVLAVGLGAAALGAIKLTKSAADDEAAQVKLATALHNATGATDSQVASVESWITAQGKTLGITDDELRPALSRLAVATGDVGKAQKLASLSMDVSAGTGKSLESVTTALAKAQNGNLTGLQRLGVATKDASGNTLSLKEVTANLADTYSGQAAKAAETTAGKQKILTTQLSELGEKIGTVLLPALGSLADAGIEVVDWIDQNQTAVVTFVGAVVGLTTVVWAVGAATKAWAAISAIASAATKVWAAGQWILNAALSANPIGLVVIAVAALVAGFVIAYKKSETFRAIVQAVGQAGKTAIGWIVDRVGDLVGAIDDMIGWVKGKASAVWTVLKSAAGEAITPVAKLLLKMVEYGIRGFRLLLGAAFSAFAGILHAADKGLGWIPGLGPKIRNAADNFDAFRARTTNNLDAVAAKARAMGANLDHAARDRVSHFTVIYDQHGQAHSTAGGHTVSERAIVGPGTKSGALPSERSSAGGRTVNITYNGPIYTQDPDELARKQARRLREALAIT